MGEFVGTVKELRNDSFNVAGTASFSNGDGLCFLNADHELEGFRVNRVVGNRIFPFKMPQQLRSGVSLYRNNDEAFNKVLAGQTAERRLPIDMAFDTTEQGFRLRAVFKPEDGRPEITVEATVVFAHQPAKTPQADNLHRQLSKLGNTVFALHHLDVLHQADTFFIPSSLLSDLRRQVAERLSQRMVTAHHRHQDEIVAQTPSDVSPKPADYWHPAYKKFSYLYNVSNSGARAFYAAAGREHLDDAFEITPQHDKALLMQCRHCLRYTLGYCVRHGGRKPEWREPLSLRLGDGRKFRLEFKCDECQMNIYSE